MTNLEASLNKPAVPSDGGRGRQAAIPKWLPFCFLIFSAIGFADATYLTVKHFLGTPIPCAILQGCEQVTNSQFATIFGVPVALLGSGYYLTVLILTVIYLDTRKVFAIKLAASLTIFGFLASLWFIFLQVFIIKAICLYCMVSAATSTLLFIIGMVYLIKNRRVSNDDARPELPN